MNINEVATLAHTIKKPTKIIAFDIINRLSANMGDLLPDDMAKLYAFFLPPVSKPKTPDQWVSLAMGKKDVRYYLNYLYSDGARLTATDGHRLHFIRSELPEGYYDTAMNKCLVDTKYPDISCFLKEHDYENPLDITKLKIIQICGLDYFDVYGVCLQASYVKDAVSLMVNPAIHYTSSTSNVCITDDTGLTAVIMPMRGLKK